MANENDPELRVVVRSDLAHQLAAALAEVARLDPAAVGDLIQQRVPCAASMASHPGVPVSPDGELGLMGLLNGALAAAGCEYALAAWVDDDTGSVKGFVTMERAALAMVDAQTPEQRTL